MKKRLLSLLAAVAITLSLSACKSSETAQETQTSQTVESAVTVSETIQAAETTAPENDEVIYETLAEGQERDWKIEDVLKNDLEIDGIPISIPCTVEDLLNTLGDGYSVNNSATICYNDKETVTSLLLGDTDNTVHGVYFKYFMIDQESLFSDRGVLFFTKISNQNKYSEFLSQYTFPDEITIDDDKTDVWYIDEFSYITFSFRKGVLTSVIIGFKPGGIEYE